MSEIGLKCLHTSKTGRCLAIGATSAFFQDKGRRFSLYDALIISLTGLARVSAFSLSNQLGRPSGPGALDVFKCASCENTEYSVVTESGEIGSAEPLNVTASEVRG